MDGAIRDFNTTIELNPKSPDAYFYRGNASKSKGDLDRAVADFTKAIALDHNYAGAYAGRGLALLRQGKDQEAETDFKKAVELDSGLKSLIEQDVSIIKRERQRPQL